MQASTVRTSSMPARGELGADARAQVEGRRAPRGGGARLGDDRGDLLLQVGGHLVAGAAHVGPDPGDASGRRPSRGGPRRLPGPLPRRARADRCARPRSSRWPGRPAGRGRSRRPGPGGRRRAARRTRASHDGARRTSSTDVDGPDVGAVHLVHQHRCRPGLPRDLRAARRRAPHRPRRRRGSGRRR